MDIMYIVNTYPKIRYEVNLLLSIYLAIPAKDVKIILKLKATLQAVSSSSSSSSLSSHLLSGQHRLRHLPNIQIHPLPPHPPLPVGILLPRPIAQPTGTRLRYDFRYPMPREPRRTRHVHRISRAKSNHFASFPVVMADHEKCVAADTDADKANVALFAYIAVHGQSIVGGVEVDYCRLGFCLRERGA